MRNLTNQREWQRTVSSTRLCRLCGSGTLQRTLPRCAILRLNLAMHLDSITLTDPSAGSTAKILPGFGFNCYSFQAVHDGRPVELLWTMPEFANEPQRPSGNGIPILFPFPGRVQGTQFHFEDREFELQAADGRGNAIHGFVFDRPWEVVEQSEARAVGRFHASQGDAKLPDLWPADFCLTVTYELQGNALHSEFLIENPGDGPLPWGLGTHPYFRIPLVSGGDAATCRVTVPAREYWELNDMIPTGNRLPAEGSRDVAQGIDFADAQFDDVFTGLEFTDGTCTATVHDPQAGCTLAIAWDKLFSNCVVYNPPHREAISIEPYTCVPGAFGKTAPVENALNLLPPDESVRGRITVALTTTR